MPPTPAPPRTRRNPILLTYSPGAISVEPRDEDRFVMTARRAAAALAHGTREDEILRQVKGTLLEPLREWCESHASRVRACYVVPTGRHLDLFVVGREATYDSDLGRELSRLELSLVDRGWRVSVGQIPGAEPDDIDTFFKCDEAIEVYAQPQ